MAPRRIFLCYRRADTAHVAGRLFDRLSDRYGSNNIFMDVDSIQPGVDFADAIERTLDECAVLLVLIGKAWLGDTRNGGRSRLDEATDVVRFEIASALRRGVRVIPVLVDGAEMPAARHIPPELAPLSRRNAVRLDHETFRSDFRPLTEALDQALVSQQKGPAPVSRGPSTAAAHHRSRTSSSATPGGGKSSAAPSSGPGVRKERNRWSSWRMLVGAAPIAVVALTSTLFLPDLVSPGTTTTTPTASAPPPEPEPAPPSVVAPDDDQGGQVIGGPLTEDEQAMVDLMSPEDRARYLLAKRINDKAEMAVLLSQLQSQRHQTSMSVINNIR
jgi:hypothetical protein